MSVVIYGADPDPDRFRGSQIFPVVYSPQEKLRELKNVLNFMRDGVGLCRNAFLCWLVYSKLTRRGNLMSV